MKVGTGGNLGLSRVYHKNLFGPLFYTWWNCPLMTGKHILFIIHNIFLKLYHTLLHENYEKLAFQILITYGPVFGTCRRACLCF